MKIKVKKIDKNVVLPSIIDKGDWVDLYIPKSVVLEKPLIEGNEVSIPHITIPLGIAMKLPEGYEAILALRSSSPKKYGIIIPNGFGIIDNSYCGNSDEWKLLVNSFKNVIITEGSRVCQFRIQLSQKATILQKLKWLFTNKIELEEVNNLNRINRGGIGSTGM